MRRDLNNVEENLEKETLTNVQTFETELGIKGEDNIVEGLNKETLEQAGQMFLYLNLCPKDDIHIFWFIRGLLRNHSPGEVLSTFNRLKKTFDYRTHLNSYFDKILEELEDSLELKFRDISQYPSSSLMNSEKSPKDLQGLELLQRVSNHPVHILDDHDNLSPSAFIPFCSFGRNAKSLGRAFENFSIPVCDKFFPKVFNDQLCYEIDLGMYSSKKDNIEDLEIGLSFVADTNEDRQVKIDDKSIDRSEETNVMNFKVNQNKNDFMIYLDSLGYKH